MNVLNLLLVSVQIKSHRTPGQNHEHQAYNIIGKVQRILIRLCSFSVQVRNSLYNPCWYLWLLFWPVSRIGVQLFTKSFKIHQQRPQTPTYLGYLLLSFLHQDIFMQSLLACQSLNRQAVPRESPMAIHKWYKTS